VLGIASTTAIFSIAYEVLRGRCTVSLNRTTFTVISRERPLYIR
jgi:hypothetical protein